MVARHSVTTPPTGVHHCCDSSDADTGYQGGAEVRFGRYLNDCWAIEAGYWGLVPNEDEANVCNACMNVELTSPIRFDNLVYDNGAFIDDVLFWYGVPGDPALRHRLRRKFEAHNIELNLIRNPCRRTGCVHFELLAGIRYLKFDDNFSFATDYTSDAFGDDPANELDYVVDVENYLLGFQVGGRMDYYRLGRSVGERRHDTRDLRQPHAPAAVHLGRQRLRLCRRDR